MNLDNKILRSDGRVEWICEHGVGHVVSVPSNYRNESFWWIHGCDGCCEIFNQITKETNCEGKS